MGDIVTVRPLIPETIPKRVIVTFESSTIIIIQKEVYNALIFEGLNRLLSFCNCLVSLSDVYANDRDGTW